MLLGGVLIPNPMYNCLGIAPLLASVLSSEMLLAFGRPKVNIEDVVGGSGRLPEVRGKDAPVIVLASEV